MDTPESHKVYLGTKPYSLRCSSSIFTDEEFRALNEFGTWMEALANSAIQPSTDEQRRFLKVCAKEIEPSTLYEKAWIKMLARREYERETSPHMPASNPTEDYGIPESDLEHWW